MAMSAEERQQMLLTQPVEKIIPKMALPTICSMLITSIYNMADTYFVSQIGTAEATASGTSASAAVGIVFSVMAMIQALAFMFGMGSEQPPALSRLSDVWHGRHHFRRLAEYAS